MKRIISRFISKLNLSIKNLSKKDQPPPFELLIWLVLSGVISYIVLTYVRYTHHVINLYINTLIILLICYILYKFLLD